ncbi:MAG: hypothetical protein NVS4B3_16530 [Gemmatimonadaceae bacterium]
MASGRATAQGRVSETAPGAIERGIGGARTIFEVSAPTSATPLIMAPATSVVGGVAVGVVVEEKPGPDKVSRKHLAGVKYEDLAVRADLGQLGPLIKRALDNSVERFNATLTVVDATGKTQEVTQVVNAIVSGIDISNPDATTRDACFAVVTLAPTYTKRNANPGAPPSPPAHRSTCHRASFRLSIPGLEEAAKVVSKIEGLTMKRKVVEGPGGERRDGGITADQWEASNVTLTLPPTHAQALYAWFDDFVIKGNAARDQLKTLDVEFLDQASKPVLTLHGTGVGVVSLRTVDAAGVRHVEAQLFVEQWKVTSLSVAAGGPVGPSLVVTSRKGEAARLPRS